MEEDRAWYFGVIVLAGRGMMAELPCLKILSFSI
jgi:hypothetical protein